MLFWKIFSLIVGVLGALVGIYFREAYRRALLQKRIASQLSAYLNKWQTDLLKNPQYAQLVVLAERWQSARELAALSGIDGLVDKIQAEQKKHDRKYKSCDKRAA